MCLHLIAVLGETGRPRGPLLQEMREEAVGNEAGIRQEFANTYRPMIGA
jgi:hypothetical protein